MTTQQHGVREVQSMHFFLDSQYRTGGTSYAPRWNLIVPQAETRSIAIVTVKAIAVPNVVYPINDNCNTLQFVEEIAAVEGPVLTVTLTNGGYSGAEIAASLQTLMNAVGTNTYTVTYNAITAHILIASAPDTFRIVSGNVLNAKLGFSETGFTQAASHESDVPVNLKGTSYVDVRCNLLNRDIFTDGPTGVIARLDATNSFGDWLHFRPARTTPLTGYLGALSSFELELLDDSGNVFALPNTYSFTFEMFVEFH